MKKPSAIKQHFKKPEVHPDEQELEEAHKRALVKFKADFEKFKTYRVPVKTGNLKQSLTATIIGKKVKISGVYYMKYVWKGRFYKNLYDFCKKKFAEHLESEILKLRGELDDLAD